ncbi:MAG: hypothetical protein ACI86H_002826, partial [bacterium]
MNTILDEDIAINQIASVDFASENIKAYTVSNVRNFHICNRSIVVNMGSEEIYIEEKPQKGLAPRKSTVLKHKNIEFADLLMVLEVKSKINIGNVLLRKEWDSAEDLFGDALKGVPLWKSPQVEIGEIELNPFEVLDQKEHTCENVKFKIKVNIWFATEKANCAIHNQH